MLPERVIKQCADTNICDTSEMLLKLKSTDKCRYKNFYNLVVLIQRYNESEGECCSHKEFKDPIMFFRLGSFYTASKEEKEKENNWGGGKKE